MSNGSFELAKDKSPRIWALLGARAGDNDQVIALAEALGLPFEIKQLSFNRLRHLGPRLLGGSLVSLTRDSRRSVLSDPPPDLTISTGHRAVPLVQALRHRSEGRTRSVHVGFPRISPERFDLVISTPQYAPVDHANILELPFALTRTAVSTGSARDAALAQLPAPRRLVVVGGPNIYWRLDEAALREKLTALIEDCRRDGGSVLVTTSPRTPKKLKASIGHRLQRSRVPTLLAEPGGTPTYASLLAVADHIWVTADSVAMISDAIWTGKPMALLPVDRNWLGRLVLPVSDRLRPGSHAYPQDLRPFWRALAAMGLGEEPAVPRVAPDDNLRQTVERVQAITRA